MKKIIAMVMAIAICLSLVGCMSLEERDTEVKDHTRINFERATEFVAVPQHDDLYYSQDTRVVYIIVQAKAGGGYSATSAGFMSPYYAPNGLPYLYDIDRQKLVEIKTNITTD